MNKALYRAYRSKTFNEVIGQNHVTDLLAHAIESGKISHAYLLTGPRGVGKTSIARIIAHSVNKLPYSEDPHLDIIEIDAASNRRIDDIRDLRDKVHVSPVSAPYKVYIIDEVHMLTGESFNALLKTLEEPPQHVIFILATTEVHKLPATIISRTQRFHLRPATTNAIVSHLSGIAQKESIDVNSEALEIIAQHAGGSFRDSLSLLDQLSGLGVPVTSQIVEAVLGMASVDSIDALAHAITAHDTPGLVSALDALYDEGISAAVIVEQLTSKLLKEARKKPELYIVIDSLCDVGRAYDPSLKLTATLVKATLTDKHIPHKSNAPLAVSNTAIIAKKPSEIKRSAIQEVATSAPVPTAQTEKKPSQTAKPPASAGVFSWDDTLETIQKHYAPLHSVLKRADVTYDEQSQSLTLAFHYALHRKKLENAQYRKQLSSVIYDLFSFEPELILTDPKSSTPLSKEAGDVAAIMGGGEIVNGAI